jgi:hypothetical protein
VEAVDVLRRVGPTILKYTLRAYGGQLSRLIFALRLWADSNAKGDRPDADMFEEYISAAFGRRHHLTSLFRYALCANGQLGERSDTELQPTEFDPHQVYQLGSHVRVLSDMHDCGLLLERIGQDADGLSLLDESATGGLGVYLISVSGGVTTGYHLDPGVEAMLGFFAEPRSCSQVADLVREISGLSRVEPTLHRWLMLESSLRAHIVLLLHKPTQLSSCRFHFTLVIACRARPGNDR